MPLRDAERAALQAALSGVDPHEVTLWRKTRWSNEDDPISEPRVQEVATPHHAHAMAQVAYRVAEAAAGIIEQRLGQTSASKRISFTSPERRDELEVFGARIGSLPPHHR